MLPGIIVQGQTVKGHVLSVTHEEHGVDKFAAYKLEGRLTGKKNDKKVDVAGDRQEKMTEY
jgi:hypothetical protein